MPLTPPLQLNQFAIQQVIQPQVTPIDTTNLESTFDRLQVIDVTRLATKKGSRMDNKTYTTDELKEILIGLRQKVPATKEEMIRKIKQVLETREKRD